MSSTSRGGQREASDYYVTPQTEILKFLQAWKRFPEFKDKNILDPCAGGDIHNKMSYPYVLSHLGCQNITTLDIRPDSRAEIIDDYLMYCFPIQFDLIITNPPFALAREIITRAIKEVAEGGCVVMLLRLNFFGSKQRKLWWEGSDHPKSTFTVRVCLLLKREQTR
jgi:hypothetical protein